MRWTVAIVLALAVLGLARRDLLAEDKTKEGQLAHPLKVVQLQGGFAGFTGVQYTIAPDGAWTTESVFNEKRTPKSKGKLDEKQLAKLRALLEKYDAAGLPEKSGKEPGANPHTITIEYGKKKSTLVGQTPPRLDPKEPAGTVESRFAGIWEGIVGMLSPPAPKRED